ncbi:MAG TPA: RCC1 domain-containing protein [Candidatus Brocadiaceae bacterium]
MKNAVSCILGRFNSSISKAPISLLFALCIVCNVSLAETIRQVSAGWEHTVALKSDGTVWTWGANKFGQLGDGTTIAKSLPIQVGGISKVVAIDGGAGHTVAAKLDGTVWAWGLNNYGQLGDATTENKNIPVQVNGLLDIIAVACGGNHSVSLNRNGDVWTWGANEYGQLGIGGETSPGSKKNKPEKINGLGGIIALACGGSHTIALSKDGEVYGWGCNQKGQIGDGTNIKRTSPVKVNGLSGIIAITSGGALGGDTNSHNLALKSDGTVWAWGSNSDGQLGDGTDTDRNIPVQVGGLSHVIAIAGGGAHSVALKSDGTVWAWGCNWAGQLGIGIPFSAKNKPVRVKHLSNIITIASGWMHSIAEKSDGTLYAWGYNELGELGDGTFTNRSLPVPVKLPLLETDTATDITSNSVALHSASTVTARDKAGNDGNDTIEITGNRGVPAPATPVITQTDPEPVDAGLKGVNSTDKNIPNGTAKINNNADHTNSCSVTLNLSASDDAGIAGYFISIDSTKPLITDSGWKSVPFTTSYSEDVPFTLGKGDGTKTVYVWYKDTSENISEVASDSIYLDMTAPVVNITTPVSSKEYLSTNSAISLGGSAEDDKSGVNSVTWSDDMGRSGIADGTTNWTISDIGLPLGSIKITVTAMDVTGNTGSTGIIIAHGMASTVMTVSASNITSDSVTLGGKVNACGLSTTAWFEYGTESSQYGNTTPPQNLEGTTDSVISAGIMALLQGKTYYYRVAARNNAGTTYGDEMSFDILDTTDPSVSITDTCLEPTYTATPSSAENVSKEEASPDPVVSEVDKKNKNIRTPESAKERVGNKSKKASESAHIKDTEPPDGFITINNDEKYTDSRSVAVNLSATDNVGIVGYYISMDPATPSSFNPGWKYITSTPRLKEDVSYIVSGKSGAKIIYAWYKDFAGNVSKATSDDIVLNITPPVGSLTVNRGSKVTHSRNVVVNLTAMDDVAITAYYISLNATVPASTGPGWKTITPTAYFTGDVPYNLSGDDGYKTIYVWYRDVTGMVSSVSGGGIILDTKTTNK